MHLLQSTSTHRHGRYDPKWQGTDLIHLYQKNITTQPKNWKYATADVKYTMNSDGFRCSEFNSIDWANSVVWLGCSITFGTGVDDTETVTEYFSQLSGLPVVNLGQQGVGLDYIVDTLNHLHLLGIKPKHIVIQFPHTSRTLRFVSSERTEHLSVHSPFDDFQKYFFFYDYHQTGYNLMFKRMIDVAYPDAVCYTTHIYVADALDVHDLSPDRLKAGDYARDLMHPGAEYHQAVAQEIYHTHFA